MFYLVEVCVYKGTTYQQGQKWQDGCNYNCECTDGMTGHYTCTARYVIVYKILTTLSNNSQSVPIVKQIHGLRIYEQFLKNILILCLEM